MAVRAKFKCTKVEKQEGDSGFVIEAEPVMKDGSPENDEFFRWTPGGKITLQTVNENAAAEFEVGKEFYVDFEQVEE